MFDDVSPQEEQRLAARLKREAQAERPEFSPSLEARILEAIRSRQAAALRRRGARAALRGWLYAGAAAAGLLAAVWLVWQWIGPLPETPHAPFPSVAASQGKPPGLRDHAPRLPTPRPVPAPGGNEAVEPDGPIDAVVTMPDRTFEDMGTLVQSNMTSGQWAYLDHDAQVATSFLLDQLPLELAGGPDQ